MINLSLWQFRRLDERQIFNQEVRERSTAAVVDITSLDLGDPASVEWRTVGAEGTYVPAEQVLILNRSQGGRAGFNVATPLLLADGRAVIVNRGFIAQNEQSPPAPTGFVRVLGTIRQSEIRRTAQSTELPGDLQEFFRLDIERLSKQIDIQLLPVALVAQVSQPADDATIQPVAAPVLSQGPHLSYAIQWLIFATAVLLGWILAVRKSVINRSRSLP